MENGLKIDYVDSDFFISLSLIEGAYHSKSCLLFS